MAPAVRTELARIAGQLGRSEVVDALRAAGCVFAEDEADLLIETAAGGDDLNQLLQRRVAGAPLEHLVGFVDFCGSRYRLGPGVFIPRQRSALLVEEAVRLGGSTILDLCCGCGALGLAVQERLGGRLVASDLSADAVAFAQENGVTQAHLGDLFDAVPAEHQGHLDLVIANTPYVPSSAVEDMPRESREHEPRASVDGGPDGMSLQRRVLDAAADWLSRGGHLLTETSTVQAPSLLAYALATRWNARVVHDDDLGATILVVARTA